MVVFAESQAALFHNSFLLLLCKENWHPFFLYQKGKHCQREKNRYRYFNKYSRFDVLGTRKSVFVSCVLSSVMVT